MIQLAPVAQWTEQVPSKHKVAGSNPAWSANGPIAQRLEHRSHKAPVEGSNPPGPTDKLLNTLYDFLVVRYTIPRLVFGSALGGTV